jgi:hypothetical protein
VTYLFLHNDQPVFISFHHKGESLHFVLMLLKSHCRLPEVKETVLLQRQDDRRNSLTLSNSCVKDKFVCTEMKKARYFYQCRAFTVREVAVTYLEQPNAATFRHSVRHEHGKVRLQTASEVTSYVTCCFRFSARRYSCTVWHALTDRWVERTVAAELYMIGGGGGGGGSWTVG